MSDSEKTFRVQVAGGEKLQEVYQRLNSRNDMVVKLRPDRSDNKIYVDFEKRGFFSIKSHNLGYLTRSKDLLFQLEQGYKIVDPKVAGFYSENWGKQLILKITLIQPSFDDMVFMRRCPHCNETNLETDTICRECRRDLD